MDEKRLSARLVKVWEALLELNPPPMLEHFNVNSVSDIWQQCAVISVRPDRNARKGYTMVFDYIGEDARSILRGIDEGVHFQTQTLNRSIKKMLASLDGVIEENTASVNSGTSVGLNNKVLKYRVCLLPFTDKQNVVTNIVVGFSWIEC